MRTTFTLDADIAPRLKALSQKKKVPMRKILNDLIRAAIMGSSNSSKSSFVVQASALGLKSGLDPSKLNSLYDELEGNSL